MKTSFHHVALKVTDYERSVAFYKTVFGVKELRAWTMDDGAKAAMLALDDGGIIEIFGNGTAAAESNARFAHFAIGVDSAEAVDAGYARALENGAKVQTPPFDFTIPSEPGFPIRIAFVKGLDDEVLEFFYER